MLVGEQPGDREDIEGEPFVGPAGQVFTDALSAAGIAHSDVYLTNAVKHFRFSQSSKGKRRIHEKPGMAHIEACHPWLEADIHRRSCGSGAWTAGTKPSISSSPT